MSKTTLTWVIFTLIAGLSVFYVKHIVENLEDELAQLESSINADNDEVHVLRAEWAYLSRPERVQKLAGQYLNLEPASGAQIADVKAIPFPGQQGNQNGLITTASWKAE